MKQHTFHLPFFTSLRYTAFAASIPIVLALFQMIMRAGDKSHRYSLSDWFIIVALIVGGCVLLLAALSYFMSMAFPLVVNEESVGCYTWYGARKFIPWDSITSVKPFSESSRRAYHPILAELTAAGSTRTYYLNVHAIYDSEHQLRLFVNKYAGGDNPLAVYLEEIAFGLTVGSSERNPERETLRLEDNPSYRFTISTHPWFQALGVVPVFILIMLIIMELRSDPSPGSLEEWMNSVVIPFLLLLIPLVVMFVYGQLFAVTVTKEGITCNTWYGARRTVPWNSIKGVSYQASMGFREILSHHKTRPRLLFIESSAHQQELYLALHIAYNDENFYSLVRRYAGARNPLSIHLKKHPYVNTDPDSGL